jgi:type IV pilus assembly protein PilY1
VKGTEDTLADVAAYYYNTDLRTDALRNCTGAMGVNVCENNVQGGSKQDDNAQQHMTTFTLGLGVNGKLIYDEDYLQGGSVDFQKLINGGINWPDPIANSGAERVDDLWHAAVNGRGTYFSAQDPSSLVRGLSKALAGAKARPGSASAAATSNLEPVAGDNFIFIALYRTVLWDGDLQAKTIDPDSGAIAADPTWTAQSELDKLVTATSDSRNIYTYDSSALNKLKPFSWATGGLNATEKAYFSNVCNFSTPLSQCATDLTAEQKAIANDGANLVNFLRGQSGNEDQASNTDVTKRVYRDREHVLGDMISSQPVYVKTPPFSYVDANYDAFKQKHSRIVASDGTVTQQGRKPMVYVAVNDGMLHAFNGDTGVEEWAYIPPIVMPSMYKLADKNYTHQYYVDGSPTVGDICPNKPVAPATTSVCTKDEWKTILVGGLNAGGRGYYALDITNPADPKALWNFTVTEDTDLGLTFGNPVITKRKDGTWVVVFTSGYNNISPGDGKGYLYVLNADTGEKLEKIATNAGDATTPSGLAKINAWIDNTTDNTAKRFYGGDMLGNVWRFDTDDVVPPAGKEALQIAELGNVAPVGIQPVTIKPELTEIIDKNGAKHAVVHIGTGRYLGVSDVTDASQQSIYSFKDNLTDTGLGKVRTPGVLVKQTLKTNASGTERTTSNNDVDWTIDSGWYIDLNPNGNSPGERVNVDMQQQQGLLTVAANVPDPNACTVGGYAWLYYFDYKTGRFVPGAANGMVGKRLGQNALVAGIKTIQLKTKKTVTLITDTAGGITGSEDNSSGSGAGVVKRVSWRELLD